jgi:hypothetical protein
MTVSPIRELLPGRNVGVSAPPGPAQGADACALSLAVGMAVTASAQTLPIANPGHGAARRAGCSLRSKAERERPVDEAGQKRQAKRA